MTPTFATDRADLVVYLAGSRFDGPPGHDRHLAEALSAHRPVLFVDPPVSALTRLRHPELGTPARDEIRIVTPRLAHLVTAVVPGHTRPGLHLLTPPLVRRAVRHAIDRLCPGSGPVAALVCSRIMDVLGTVPARRTLYYATDDLVAGADLLGVPHDRLLRTEADLLRRADLVAAVSPPLRQRFLDQGYAATLLPNGCSPDAYAGIDAAPPASDVSLPGPVAGFVGHVNDRIDLALLEAVADSGASLLVVGPVANGYREVGRFAELTGRPNVTWVGRRPYAEMPGYLKLIDVGLTPYGDTAFNRGSFPLKTLEYLAAGRAVVATGLPAHTWLDTELITIADGPAPFAAAVTDALAAPRTPELVERRRAFAQRHSWPRRADDLAELLGLGDQLELGDHPGRPRSGATGGSPA